MQKVLLYNYARSGGTLFSRCLGSLPDTMIVSEVHPAIEEYIKLEGRCGDTDEHSTQIQAKKWFDLDLEPYEFGENIQKISDSCEKYSKSLVVRYWSFLDFTASPFNFHTPPGMLTAARAMPKGLEFVSVAFVRDAIDVWLSRGQPDQKVFFADYLRYVEALKEMEIPIFKYEEFCDAPEAIMRSFCEYTGLPFSADFLKKYNSFNSITGDTVVLGGSRGMNAGKIKSLKRKRIRKSKIKLIEKNADMHRANGLLNYPTSYYDQSLESRIESINRKVVRAKKVLQQNGVFALLTLIKAKIKSLS